ncbi:MAG TPA: hypothetical protein VF116_19125 [Ktedonobacterales bacterium]
MPGNGKRVFISGNRRTRIVVSAASAALLVILAAAAFSLAVVLPQRSDAHSDGSSQAPATSAAATPSATTSPATPSAVTMATETPAANRGQPAATPLPVTPFLKYTLTQPLATGWSLSSNAPQSDPYAQRDTFSYPPGATTDPGSGITVTPALSVQRTQVYGEIPPGEGYLIGPTMTFQLANATCQGQEDPVPETTQPRTIVIFAFCQAYGHNYRLRIDDLAANYSHDAASLFAPLMSAIQFVP